jgi:hypothetical protein
LPIRDVVPGRPKNVGQWEPDQYEAIRIENAFDDPFAVRALVERHGPYRAMASYLPVSATRGEQATTVQGGVLPWFRGTWAANGWPLVKGADLILENAHFREAASQLFNGAEVPPSAIVVNVNAPMPPGAIHIDIPSFRGATRDRHSIQLLQAMGSSGLFEGWRVIEAGAVVWFYEGPGGEYDYWPEGLGAPMQSERHPLTNRALVADNDRMYHRIGWIGDPAAKIPAISPGAEITHVSGTGWVIRDEGREIHLYSDKQIRISILWKGRAEPTNGIDDYNENAPLTPERIVRIFRSDLLSRGIRTPDRTSTLSDQTWLDLVHSSYYSPVNLPK